MKLNLKKSKWLVPALALLIIIESVLVVNSLGTSGEFKTKVPSLTKVAEEENPAIISFQGEKEAAVGEESSVKVVMTALKNLNLDGVDVYLKYNPEEVEIIGVDPTDEFSFVARNWIEPEKERVLVSLVEPEAPKGVNFEPGSQTTLALVEFKPLTSGQTTLEIYAPKGAEGTVLAGEGEEFEFSKEDFILNVD